MLLEIEDIALSVVCMVPPQAAHIPSNFSCSSLLSRAALSLSSMFCPFTTGKKYFDVTILHQILLLAMSKLEQKALLKVILPDKSIKVRDGSNLQRVVERLCWRLGRLC